MFGKDETSDENVIISKGIEENNPFFKRIEEENEKVRFWIGFFEGICLFIIIFQIYVITKLSKVNCIYCVIALILMIIEIFIMIKIYKILRSKER